MSVRHKKPLISLLVGGFALEWGYLLSQRGNKKTEKHQ